MPRKVVEKKTSVSIYNAIASTFIYLIPIGIIAIIGKNEADVWNNPYSLYVLALLAINSFFAIAIGIVASLNKIVWLIMATIASLGTLALLIVSYIEPMGGLLLHVATACLFTFMIYQIGETYGGDGIYLRSAVPIANVIVGLITVLWFVGEDMSITLHIVIVTILNVIFLIAVVISTVNFFQINGFKFVDEKEISYLEETEEEIAAKKEKKARIKEEKLEEKEIKKEEKRIKKEAHDNDPRVIARRESAKKVGKALKKGAKAVLGGFAALLPHFGPPRGSENWDGYDWAEYIEDRVDAAPVKQTGTLFVRGVYSGNLIEIFVEYKPYDDISYNQYNSSVNYIRDAFVSASKHCPFNVKLIWSD